MLQILLLYILIVIVEIIYTVYFSEKMRKASIENEMSIEYNLKNEAKISKIIKQKILELAHLVNSGKMSFSEWSAYVKKNKTIKIDNYVYDIVIEQFVKNNTDAIKITGPSRNDFITNKKFDTDNTLLSEYNNIAVNSEVNGGHFQENNHHLMMLQASNINETNYMTYSNIDPVTLSNYTKKSFYTKWESKTGQFGIITCGYNIKNINEIHEFRYLDLIFKPELCLTSLLLFLVSVVIFSIKTVKYSRLKSITFLICTNIYLVHFINTREYYSNVESELAKINDINSSILNVSFLSSVNIFIMNFIYSTHNKLFIETAVIFGVSIILLLTATYKSTHSVSLKDIIGARLTNQMVFNMSIFLNAAIILNFLYYSLYIRKK